MDKRVFEGGRSLCAIWENENLTCYEKITLLAFASQLNYTGDFKEWRYISRKTLCKMTSLKLRKMSDVLKSLTSKNYLLKENRKDNSGSSLASNYKLSEKLFDEYQNYICKRDASQAIPSAPHARGGCTSCTGGVHLMHGGGAPHAPHRAPSLTPSEIPSPMDHTLPEKNCAQEPAQFDIPLDPQADPLGCPKNDPENEKHSESGKKSKCTKPKKTKEKSPGSEAWDYYAVKFEQKYGLKPFSSAREYSLSKKLVECAGASNTRILIDAYFDSNDHYVLKSRHPLSLLVSQSNRFLVDSMQSAGINDQNQKQRYIPMRLSHDKDWEDDFKDLIEGNWNSIEEFRNRKKNDRSEAIK